MADKQLLHKLLEERQEPFHLQSFIADKLLQFKNRSLSPPPATNLQLRKRKPVAPKTSNFCFFSFHESPDVRNSPFMDFQSPVMMSPSKFPVSPVFLRVPPRTAAILAEAAVRIQKRRRSKLMGETGIVGFGLFGVFLKRLKNRNKHKKRVIGDKEISISDNCKAELNEDIQGRSIRLNRRDSERCRTCDQSEEISGQSSSSSPFRFSLHPSSGRLTPEFCSPVASPIRHLKQEKSSNLQITRNSDEKEHCSPVSVLDSFLDQENVDNNNEDDDLESSYANVQRVKQQLLYRLRRFERLAELDPMELEKRILESYSDEECEVGSLAVSEDDGDGTLLVCRKEQGIEVVEVFNLSKVEEISGIIKRRIGWGRGNQVCGRISKIRLESWKDQVGFVDMMVEVDLKNERDSGGWRKFPQEVDEATEEVELAIVGVLVEEVLEGMCMYCINQEQLTR